MIMLLLILIPLLFIDLYTPHVLRKTTVFGVSVPEPFVNDPQLAAFKKAYTITIARIQIPMIVLVCILAIFFHHVAEAFFILGGTFLYVLISMFVYLHYHHQVVTYKKAQIWEQEIQVVRVSAFETKFEKKGRPFPHILFIPPFLITFGLTVWLLSIYSSLPSVIPTHWGINGHPDAWSDKSIFSVFFLIGTLLFTQLLVYGMSYGTFYSSGQLKAQDTERSYEREHEMRKMTVFFMAFTNLLTTILLGWIEVQSMMNILENDHTLSMGFTLPAFLIAIFGVLFWYMKRTKQINEQFKDEQSLASAPGDDAHWKWGMFYVNRNDPNFLVEKKFGVGWTVNFAHPGTWIFLLLVLGVPLLPLFFL